MDDFWGSHGSSDHGAAAAAGESDKKTAAALRFITTKSCWRVFQLLLLWPYFLLGAGLAPALSPKYHLFCRTTTVRVQLAKTTQITLVPSRADQTWGPTAYYLDITQSRDNTQKKS